MDSTDFVRFQQVYSIEEKNFYSTVAFTTEAGLGSETLINEDTIVTVAHNFVHLNTEDDTFIDEVISKA